MTPNELRALAEALDPSGKVLTHPGNSALQRAADYLRAQADAQPVAWMHVDGRVVSAATMDQSYRDGGGMRSSLRDYTIPLYTHPAPDAPQAEPKREPLSDEQIEIPDYLRLQIACTAAAHDVLVERRRQIESEGWTPEHDDEHVLGEMAALAAFYAVPDGVRDWDFSSTGYGDTLAEALLPNGWTAKAGEDRRRDLVKAGALILAEIERIDRMGGSDAE